VGGTILDENFRVSPVLSSTRRSDTRSAPARATVGTNRSRACPFDVTRTCPAATLFAQSLGAKEASSWPRGRRHASSGLGRPISSAIDRPSPWVVSSARTLRSAFPPRRPLPPALQFFNGEGTPVAGRVADPQVSVVAPRHQPPLRLGERRSRRPARPRRRAGLAEGGHPHRSARARTTGSAELPTTSTSISSTSSTASARRTRPTKAKWRARRPAPSWPVGDETKGCLPTPQLASGDTLIRDTDD